MDTGTWIIAFVFLIIMFLGNQMLAFLSDLFEPKIIVEPKKIKYQTGSMFDSYVSIAQEINCCMDPEMLGDAYVGIIIFEINFPDSTNFTSELFEAYNIKENELKSHTH